MSDTSLGFGARFALAFKVLFDGIFAARVVEAAQTGQDPQLPAALPEPRSGHVDSAEKIDHGALHMLAILQREGRLIDFLEEDLGEFSDAEVGAAARVVHEGCKKSLQQCFVLGPLRNEAEGSQIVLQQGFDANTVRLTGNVQGEPPYKGTLVHSGWRALKTTLPVRSNDVDADIIAPAEVEL